ncbi:hypothetical protein BDV93DRAFT_522663 [Ceratobasidium sp. AG-I]|nr:hypothetical protein BDV93DRAFT_522663 [Ceratobasidium sp. AG-I]
MLTSKESPIVFYDLASKDNTPWSPSTYRTRLALIHKGIPFRLTAHNLICDLAIPLIGLEHMLDDRGHEYFVRTREEMYEKPLTQVLEEAKAIWSTDVRKAWKTIGDMLDANGPMEQAGLFVMGKEMSYSDFIIAGLVLWLQRGEGREGPHYKELLEWDGGRWGLIWKEIEKLEAKSTEV